nr:unnamed protein product [Digitaria exilis]
MMLKLAHLRAHVLSQNLITPTAVIKDISSTQHLHEKSEEVALPQLVVLQGVGGNVVGATEVQQQERRPERHELVLAQSAAEGKVAQSIRRGGVSQLVRQPEEAYPYATVFMPPHSSKEKQDNLQHEAEDYKELGCPSIPKVQ